MAIKTFNIEEDVYSQFSTHCKDNGISMSKQVEIFMRSMIEEDPVAKKEFLNRLERIRKGKFVQVNNFAEHYTKNRK